MCINNNNNNNRNDHNSKETKIKTPFDKLFGKMMSHVRLVLFTAYQYHTIYAKE